MASVHIPGEHRVLQHDVTFSKISNVMSNGHWESSVTNLKNRKRPLPIAQGEVIGPERKKQIIKGMIKCREDKPINLLIIAELWPSLLLGYVSSAKGSKIWIVCSSCPLPVKNVLPTRAEWIDTNTAADLIHTQACHWICLQGSMEFAEDTLNSWCLMKESYHIRLQVIVPARRYRGFNSFLSKIRCWKNITHVMLGGVTASKWKLGIWCKDKVFSAEELHHWCQAYGLLRRFVDVISHVENGTPAAKPDKPLPDLFAWEQRQFLKSYLLPSVFSHTRYVIRELVVKEVGALFDVSEYTIAELNKQGVVDLKAFVNLFSTEIPPLKITALMCNIMAAIPELVKVNEGQSLSVRVDSTIMNGKNLLVDPDVLIGCESKKGGISIEDYLEDYNQKAAKEDDASVPVLLWNMYVFKHGFLKDTPYTVRHGCALEVLRTRWCFPRYQRNLLRSFMSYMRKEYGETWWSQYQFTKAAKMKRKRKRSGDATNKLMSDVVYCEVDRDLIVGRDGLSRAFNSTWWEWKDGSACFFWRWPIGIRKQVRDGVPIFVQSKLPRWRKKQALPSKKYMADKMTEKLNKVVDRRYLINSVVHSLINCFAVPKGLDDIRLVYDGTKSGLNACVFAPNFFLPSIDSVLMAVDVNSWFDDHDLGEMFLNYFLHAEIQKFSGVDLTANFNSPRADWRAWGRMFMGFTASPYVTSKLFGWCIDMIYGNRWDPNNPFRWDGVILNLPGSKHYDPSRPRLYKAWKGKIAATIQAYVDDIRGIGNSEDNCKRAGARAAQIVQYLGQQDAARKYRPPHQRPGPWSGAFVGIREDCVWVYVAEDKWEKAKLFISELFGILERGEKINHKFLERGRGFMVYFCRTYTSLTPFLKGLHLTLDSWREGRDEEGWKMRGKIVETDSLIFNNEQCMEDENDCDIWEGDATEPLDPLSLKEARKLCELATSLDSPPEEISQVPRLRADVAALRIFLSAEKAPWRFIRGRRVGVVQYGFADAAKAGFGATIQDSEQGLWYRLGVWSCAEAEESSNYRELANLVETLEEHITTSDAKGIELFIFTDNSTAEAAFYKGTSSSIKLFDLVVRLKSLEMDHSCLIHFVHIAGTRMISQGTDGISRGDFNAGVMQGEEMSTFVPIHLSALEREINLKQWIIKTVPPGPGEKEIIFLSYSGWFERGHDVIGGSYNGDKVWEPSFRTGTYIWTPPPSAAQIAVEQLRQARLKRESSTHVMIVPKQMSPEWRRQLFRVSDLFVELPFDEFSWKRSKHHEPLIFAVVFPFLAHRPWQLKRTAAFLGMGRLLRSMFKEEQVSTGFILRKLFEQQRALANMQEGMVREMLRSPNKFIVLHAQRGKRSKLSLEEEVGSK